MLYVFVFLNIDKEKKRPNFSVPGHRYVSNLSTNVRISIARLGDWPPLEKKEKQTDRMKELSAQLGMQQGKNIWVEVIAGTAIDNSDKASWPVTGERKGKERKGPAEATSMAELTEENDWAEN